MRNGIHDNAADFGRDGSFSSIFEDVSAVADKIGVILQKPRIPVGWSAQRAAAAADSTVEDYYRVNVFYAAIDAVLADFKLRFSSHFRLSAGLNSLLPSIVGFKMWDAIKDAYQKYMRFLQGTATDIKSEFEIWKQHWQPLNWLILRQQLHPRFVTFLGKKMKFFKQKFHNDTSHTAFK